MMRLADRALNALKFINQDGLDKPEPVSSGIATNLRDITAHSAWHAMSTGEQESLTQLLLHGPVWDGDVISKADRDQLIRWGLAVRVCYKARQGFTAATYPAFTVYMAGRDQ